MPGPDDLDETLTNDASQDAGDVSQDQAQGADDAVDHAADDQADASQDKAADAAAADEGDAGEGDGKKSMLSAVSKILGIGKKDDKDQKDAKAAAAKDPKNPEANAAAGKDAEEKDAPAEVPAELAAHPVFQTLQKEHAVYAQSHEKLSAITGFMQKHSIDSSEMTQAMNLTALSHRDPEKFYHELVKMTDEFAIHLGKKLPADLQKDVEDGNITKERAAELAKARVDKQISDRKAERAEGVLETSAAEQEASARDNLVGRWFDGKAQKDPDIEFKVEAITGEIYRLSSERQRLGKPAIKNAQEHLALLNEAYDNVTKRFRAISPKTPVKPLPRSNSQPARVQLDKDQTPRENMADNVLNIINRSAG